MPALQSRGFTLVEILVVLIIVSVMAGVTLVGFPSLSQSSDFEAESKRLRIVLEMAREEALMQSSEFGFRLDRNDFGDFSGYSFYIYDDLNETWNSYESSPFKPRQFSGDIKLELQVEGDNEFSLDDDGEDLPPVMLLSSGEMTPFELTIYQDPDLSVTMISDGYGAIELEQDEE